MINTLWGAGNPEGQQLLADSIGHLRDTHIVFAHMSHHDLKHVSPSSSIATSPDIVARVFAAVLKEVKDDLFRRHVLGTPVPACMSLTFDVPRE